MKIQELFEAKEVTVFGKTLNGGIKTYPLKKIRKWDGYFECVYSDLTTLEGVPDEINGEFSCHDNKLKSLKGGPRHVKGDYDCSSNLITSFDDFDCVIDGDLVMVANDLSSLKDIHKHIKKVNRMFFAENPLESHVLGVLLVPNCTKVFIDDKKLEAILNSFLPNTIGRAAIYDCQDELIKAGYEEFAQL